MSIFDLDQISTSRAQLFIIIMKISCICCYVMLCHNMENVQNFMQNNQIHVECNAVFHWDV